mmetsp:Transcript_1759/g.6283  ORF Transcript_1759/g.6283 Transcript_1759/m.6283 type:complete len:99 (+) Transcript_1759:70-366(+)
MSGKKPSVWNVWRNRQTRLQLIVGFNAVVGLLWFVSYRKLQERRKFMAITAPGAYYTKEDLRDAGFDVVEINRRHLQERAEMRAAELAARNGSDSEQQ